MGNIRSFDSDEKGTHLVSTLAGASNRRIRSGNQHRQQVFIDDEKGVRKVFVPLAESRKTVSLA